MITVTNYSLWVHNCSQLLTQSQNDYLREFETRSGSYLDILMQSYGPPNDVRCRQCPLEGKWRCRDCFGGALLCRGCCRRTHLYLPLHRIERWNAKFFEPSALWDVGVRLYLGHQGGPCPAAAANSQAWREEQELVDTSGTGRPEDAGIDTGSGVLDEQANRAEIVDDPWTSTGAGAWQEEYEEDTGISLENPSDEQEWDESDQVIDSFTAPTNKLPTEDSLGGKFLTIVDSSGIHHISVLYCSCSGAPSPDQQLLAAALFPASFTLVSTVFTFHVLDDFRRDNLECKTTPYQFYQKLRRVTNSSFPQSVPNRYQELRRVSREWRQLKKRKWHGIPYDATVRGPGEMALFCAACPQPGVNLKPEWVTDKDK